MRIIIECEYDDILGILCSIDKKILGAIKSDLASQISNARTHELY